LNTIEEITDPQLINNLKRKRKDRKTIDLDGTVIEDRYGDIASNKICLESEDEKDEIIETTKTVTSELLQSVDKSLVKNMSI